MKAGKEISSKRITYLYWTLLILLALLFALSGFWEITKNPLTYQKALKMGYPPYFIITLGIAKICGAIALLMPRIRKLKEWAFAGFTFDVIFAFVSGVAINSSADCIKAGIAFCTLAITYLLFLRNTNPPTIY
jgi:uncharacterized membrane protein YphA (DoxX/SURF4 family)